MNQQVKIITILIPIYNAAQSIEELFISLEKQTNKELIKEIIIIDGLSTDQSHSFINKWQKKSSYSIKIIQLGFFAYLARKYNAGIKKCQTPYFLFMHQDSLIVDNNAFLKALNPILNRDNAIASYPLICWSRKIWENYSFWRKYMLPVGRYMPVCAGKFDCYNKQLFLNKIGYFNEKIDTAEDMDLIFKVQKKKLQLILSNVKIIHNHPNDVNFTLWKSLKVLFRVNEIQGYYVRQYGIISPQYFAITFFRPILLLGLIFPYIQYLSIVLILIYSFTYSGSMYFAKRKDIRVLLLPIVNFFALFVSSYCSIKGVILNDTFHEKT